VPRSVIHQPPPMSGCRFRGAAAELQHEDRAAEQQWSRRRMRKGCLAEPSAWADVFELPLRLSAPDYVAMQHGRGLDRTFVRQYHCAVQ
jgi:hypothetical protein